MARVYLPATLDSLGVLHDSGELPRGVERLLAASESEEDEYAALEQAADDSAALLQGPGRRVVVVAELAAAEDAVRLAQVVAVHADDLDVDPAYLTSVTAPEPPRLGWWATQEIATVLGR